MKFYVKENIFLILMLFLCIGLFSQLAFAQDNQTDMQMLDENIPVEDNLNSIKEVSEISQSDGSDKISNKNTTLFIVSDNPGTNILDKASEELLSENDLSNVNLIVRNGNQIKNMPESELIYLLSSSDVFIGEWISSDVDSVLTSVLGKNPELSNKEIFLILEPPSGNLNSDSSSIKLLRNNTLNYNKIFATYSNEELINYFKNTKRGISYSTISNYISTNGKSTLTLMLSF